MSITKQIVLATLVAVFMGLVMATIVWVCIYFKSADHYFSSPISWEPQKVWII